MSSRKTALLKAWTVCFYFVLFLEIGADPHAEQLRPDSPAARNGDGRRARRFAERNPDEGRCASKKDVAPAGFTPQTHFRRSALRSSEPGIAIRLDSYAERRGAGVAPPLFSLPPAEWSERYRAESVVYVPGENAHFTVEVSPNKAAQNCEIALLLLVSGRKQVFHSGPLTAGTYGPYEVVITSDFEVFQVRVSAPGDTVTRAFYGIKPWRGMKDFSQAVPLYGIRLGYEKTTPWDAAVRERRVDPHLIDSNWALGSHVRGADSARTDWWLWTHFACGMAPLPSDRPGFLWGQFNPCICSQPDRPQKLISSDKPIRGNVELHPAAVATETMLPDEIYFRERIQPMLREWAISLSQSYPDAPLKISLGECWGISQGTGQKYDPEVLRFFVSWMKEQFGITIQADTFTDLLQKCREYPQHFGYFIARNTTFRSLELTCEAVRDVVAGSVIWDKTGESRRQLVAFPEAVEFCGILSRCLAVGTNDDRTAFRLTRGDPLPLSLSTMVVKAFAPDHRFCVGWSGCPKEAAAGEIYRWYLEQAWLTAYDEKGKLRHLCTHSPPSGPEGVWQCLVEQPSVSDEKIKVYDRCFQLMEAIGVEKPIGPVFVCKDWTFADESSGTAFRSDLYEGFLKSLRRHKVPISCAVRADYESNLPQDLPRVYAPRMNGKGRITFGSRAGSVARRFTCEASGIPDSVIADLACELSSAAGGPVVFPAGSSIEGYAFEARGMIFLVTEEMAGRDECGEIRVKLEHGDWTVTDMIAGQALPCRREREYLVFNVSLPSHSATLYCLSKAPS